MHRSSNKKKHANHVTRLDHPQYVSLGRRNIVEFRCRPSTVTYDQPNWCLHCPRHRKNGKRNIDEFPNLKGNVTDNNVYALHVIINRFWN